MSRWLERALEIADAGSVRKPAIGTNGTNGTGHAIREQSKPATAASGGWLGVRQHEQVAGVPVWSAQLTMVAMDRPPAIPPDRWEQALVDAERFVRDWGARAVAAGWVPEDLFDVHPTAPVARYDLMGLALLIGGGTVVALDEKTATIQNKQGNCLRWFRCPRPGALPLWMLRGAK